MGFYRGPTSVSSGFWTRSGTVRRARARSVRRSLVVVGQGTVQGLFGCIVPCQLSSFLVSAKRFDSTQSRHSMSSSASLVQGQSYTLLATSSSQDMAIETAQRFWPSQAVQEQARAFGCNTGQRSRLHNHCSSSLFRRSLISTAALVPGRQYCCKQKQIRAANSTGGLLPIDTSRQRSRLDLAE